MGDEAHYGQVFNIGSTEELSIGELAERVRALTGSSSPIKLLPYEEAYGAGFEDMMRRVPDVEKIHRAIGWRASHSLDQILDSVIEHQRRTGES